MTNEQASKWRVMVAQGDRQGLVNIRYNTQLLTALIYTKNCQLFITRAKLLSLELNF